MPGGRSRTRHTPLLLTATRRPRAPLRAVRTLHRLREAVPHQTTPNHRMQPTRATTAGPRAGAMVPAATDADVAREVVATATAPGTVPPASMATRRPATPTRSRLAVTTASGPPVGRPVATGP